jgi:hypothetical protein
MRRLIRVTAGIWLLIVITLTAVLVAGRILSGRSEMIAFQSGRMADTDIFLLDVPTGITHNLTRQPGTRPAFRSAVGCCLRIHT